MYFPAFIVITRSSSDELDGEFILQLVDHVVEKLSPGATVIRGGDCDVCPFLCEGRPICAKGEIERALSWMDRADARIRKEGGWRR